MGYFDDYEIFRDPIHDYIVVYKREIDLINSRAFQRLKRIHQLGMTQFVYHGATHTRFGHSLGVMHLADRILQCIYEADSRESGDRILDWKKEDFLRYRKLVRVLGLLHDIGQGLFSHAGEKELFPQGTDHETYTAKIIKNDPEVRQVLEVIFHEDGISADELARFWEKGLPPSFVHPILKQVISGPLDADKMDYLWRDSHYCGVMTGRFDMDRLLHTMRVVRDTINEEESIGIHESGIPAAEQMLIARYYMYLQVYFNKTRRAYDRHLTDFLKNHYLDGGCYPVDIADYLLLGDDDVLSLLAKIAYDPTHLAFAVAGALVRRKHFQLLFESPENASPQDKDSFEKVSLKLGEEFGDSSFFSDNSVDDPNKFKKEVFLVRLRDDSDGTAKYRSIERVSVVIKKFDEPLLICRIYCSPELKKREQEIRLFMRRLG